MAVVMDALHRPTTPLISSSSPSFAAAHDRNHYNSHASSSSFRLHRIASQFHLHSSKSGPGCSWMLDNSKYKDILSNSKRNHGQLHAMFPPTPAEVSSVKDLFEFICAGPLIDKLGLTPETIAESIDKWLESGFHVCKLFQLNELYLTTPQKARIYHYYIPVYLWCEKQISDHRSTFKDGDDIPPLVIGFSAPQGCGKTTLVFALDYLFHTSGRKSATISIDDFYLTHDDQAKLRENNPGNALLEFRGNAGSHDLSLSVETLTALGKLTKEGLASFATFVQRFVFPHLDQKGWKSCQPNENGKILNLFDPDAEKKPLDESCKTGQASGTTMAFYSIFCLITNFELNFDAQKCPGMKMKLPRYDKSAYNGRGDRADPSTWPEAEGPLTVVLFEGWMLGFKPVPAEVVKAIDPQLEIVNKNLEAYYDAWDKFVQSWIIIKIKDPSCVYEWRLQAEIQMREAGNPGMTDEEVMDFVSRYLPAYNAYLPTLYTEGPKGSDSEHTLIVEIDEGRNPILAG